MKIRPTFPTALTSLALAASFPTALCAESYLGVYSEAVDPALGAQLGLDPGFGLVVDAVADDGPAKKAGVEKHDVLIELDGQRLVNPQQLRALVGSAEGEVTLQIIRAGERVALTAALVERPEGLDERPPRPGFLNPSPQTGPGGLRLHTFGPGADGRLEMPEIDWLLKGAGLGGLNGLGESIRKQVQDAIAEATANLPDLKEAKNVEISASASVANTVFSDGIHTLNITEKDGERHLKATDKDGEVLFDGPIDNEKQRAEVPAEILEKLEKFEGMVEITTGTVGGKTGSSTSVKVEVKGEEE